MNTSIAVRQYRNNVTRSILPSFNKAFAPEILSFLPHSLWRSPDGSLYRCSHGEFICVSVHSSGFLGWLNKAAIKNIQRVGDIWFADQAFRDTGTGRLCSWEQIAADNSNVIDRLLAFLHDEDQYVRSSVVDALGKLRVRVFEKGQKNYPWKSIEQLSKL